jgi:hypothetical protein
MLLRPCTLTLLSLVAVRPLSTQERPAAAQAPCWPERAAWVGQALQQMKTIQPGMTRERLLTVFTEEGGLSTAHRRTYVSKDCPYFKVDVEFEPVGRPDRDEDGHVALEEDSRDTITKISRPYLEFSIMD